MRGSDSVPRRLYYNKGTDREKTLPRSERRACLEIPRQGAIPAAEIQTREVVDHVNRQFGTKYREPYEIMHSGIEEHQTLYCQLAGI